MKTKAKKMLVEKWEKRYENEHTISIWKYNSKISRINPYEIVIEYKNEQKEVKPRTRKKKS